MRAVGLVLVAVGVVVLAAGWLGLPAQAAAGVGGPAAGVPDGWASPLAGGITLVCGLLFLASDRRRG